jgi:hypothetical protein
VLSAFLQAEAPQQAGVTPLGSFEQWSRIVRGALIWLDLPDPVGSQDSLLIEDPDADQRAELFGALWERFRGEPFVASDVVRSLEAAIPGPGTGGYCDPLDAALLDAFRSECPDGRITRERAGRILARHRDQVSGVLSLTGRRMTHDKAMKWQMTELRT